MEISEHRLQSMKKAIAVAADGVEDIPHLLMLLARVPDEEWNILIENSNRHKMRYTSGNCLLCQSFYEGYMLPYYVGMCKMCQKLYQHEGAANLPLHRGRARDLGLPATLTLAEWIINRHHFNDLCAYCQQRPGNVVEHFIPLTLGGGTVASNVVPCCGSCNRKKRNTHPDKIKTIPRVDIERVREYLNSLKIAS